MIFGREPAIWLGMLRAILSAVVILGWWKLTTDQSGAILAVASGVAGAILAFHVRPFPPAAVTHLLEACVALVLSFKFHVSPEQLASVVLVIQLAVAVATRQSVVPLPPEGVWYHPAARRARV